MYKAGKNWVFAMLSTIALTGVMAMSVNTAKADTVAQSSTEQIAKVDTTSSTTTSTQATTQLEKATNTTNESNATQTAATTTTEQSSSNASATSSSQNNKQATTTSVSTLQSTSVANKDQASSTQSSTTQKSEEPKVETPVNTADNASQKNVNGNWYLVDNNTGKNLTGFQEIKDQNKVVYYAPSNAQMQYGWQNINSNKYYFDKFSGAMTTGQRNIDGSWYLFDNQGVMQTGFQRIENQNKTVYYNKNGQMQYGQQVVGNHWYLFDRYSGAMLTGFQNLAPYGQDKTVYYNKDGQLQYGSQVINGKKYYFDKSSGKMYIGVAYNADTRTIQYYASNGQMQFGKVNISGKTYDFDDKTGNLLMQGLVTLGGKNYLLDSNYKAITGQQVIGNHWYLFSKYDGSMQTGFQDLTPYGQNKTVYYATNGQMQYGKQNIGGHWYLFDQYSGAMYKGWLISGNDWYYYNQQNGQLQTGSAVINGVGYNFDGNGKQILNYSIDYRYALPAGKGDDETAANNYIILHDVGVESGAAANARYFHDTVDTNEAYVTFVVGDGGKVYQVGRPGQVSWGAGRVANHNAPVQIELGRTYNSGQFWQDYVTYVRVARDMAGKYGIPLTLDAGGAGTRGIKSHYWVTKNIWGDHVDPYGYLSRFGVTQAKLAHDLLYGV